MDIYKREMYLIKYKKVQESTRKAFKMKDIIVEKLKLYMRKKKRIELLEMMKWVPGDTEYEDFAPVILKLQEEGILLPVKAQKMNGRTIALYNMYNISQEKLKSDYITEIHELQQVVNVAVQLKHYVVLSETIWQEDKPWIIQIDKYIKRNGLPVEEATSAERSYLITGNEKWLDEKHGTKVLERLELLEAMKIVTRPDPLMFAINKKCFREEVSRHKHLIVENKSIFYMLQEILSQTDFTSIIYGCGWKITAGLDNAITQMDLQREEHSFYYFGDLDFEGIAIYEYLGEKVKLATPFYEALLQLQPSQGKENQKQRLEKLEQFITHFTKAQGNQISQELKKGYYYPQEALDKATCLACLKRI